MTSCCLQGAPTCCTDSSSDFFNYAPGRPIAILDSEGNPMSSTSSNTTITDATVTPLASSRSTASSNNYSDNAGEIGLGVVLGVVLVAAAVAITALSMKTRPQIAMRKRTEATLAAARSHEQSYWPGGHPSSSPPWVPPPVELPSRQPFVNY